MGKLPFYSQSSRGTVWKKICHTYTLSYNDYLSLGTCYKAIPHHCFIIWWLMWGEASHVDLIKFPSLNVLMTLPNLNWNDNKRVIYCGYWLDVQICTLLHSSLNLNPTLNIVWCILSVTPTQRTARTRKKIIHFGQCAVLRWVCVSIRCSFVEHAGPTAFIRCHSLCASKFLCMLKTVCWKQLMQGHLRDGECGSSGHIRY